MPFLSSFIQLTKIFGTIYYMSGGDDINTGCATTVTLNAVIIGNIDGHTFLWEQISGSAVTFVGPVNGTSITYTQTNYDDKLFRLWADKDTVYEQYADVSANGTPTTKLGIGPPQAASNITDTDDVCKYPVLTYNVFVSVEPENVVYCAGNISNPILNWSIGCTNYLSYFLIQKRLSVNSPWTDVTTVPSTQQDYRAVELGYTYRVLSVFSDGRSFKSNTVYANPDFDIRIDQDIVSSYVSDFQYLTNRNLAESVTQNYNILVITLINLEVINNLIDPLDNDAYFGQIGDSTNNTIITNYNVLVVGIQHFNTFANLIDPLDNDAYFGTTGDEANHTVITNYNVLDLTGGEIGG